MKRLLALGTTADRQIWPTDCRGGTGVLTHFRAGPIAVACPALPDCSWDGPYGFNPPGDGD